MLISSYCVVADDIKINVVTFEYCRYLRNAATFKDIRAGENGLELFKVGKPFSFYQILGGIIDMCCRGK